MEHDEKQFFRGFNDGYVLAEFEPLMLTVLLKNIQPFNSYISGISFGQKEFELEQTKSHLNDLGRLRQIGKDEKDRAMD